MIFKGSDQYFKLPGVPATGSDPNFTKLHPRHPEEVWLLQLRREISNALDMALPEAPPPAASKQVKQLFAALQAFTSGLSRDRATPPRPSPSSDPIRFPRPRRGTS